MVYNNSTRKVYLLSGRNLSSVMPGVNELTQKFEQTARKEYSDAQRNRRSPPCNAKKSSQKSPREGTTRVVVVSKPGPEFVYSTDEARVRRVERPSYSPSDMRTVISTTIVDIEPPNYRTSTPRYIEETYQEEYRSIKTYSNTPNEKPYRQKEVLSPIEGKKEIIKIDSKKKEFNNDKKKAKEERSMDKTVLTPITDIPSEALQQVTSLGWKQIIRVRFLEAQNRILEHDLNILKSGKHAQSVYNLTAFFLYLICLLSLKLSSEL
uniref:Reverse transcriptase domain-containing protein n=1 Tax=Heterorhabditis bacteriophora TaxID=37862 RepID=A0A1I7XCN7_HETBA